MDIREKIAKLISLYCRKCPYLEHDCDSQALCVGDYYKADQILVLIKEAGYVLLPPDSAILTGVSKLKEGLDSQIE